MMWASEENRNIVIEAGEDCYRSLRVHLDYNQGQKRLLQNIEGALSAKPAKVPPPGSLTL